MGTGYLQPLPSIVCSNYSHCLETLVTRRLPEGIRHQSGILRTVRRVSEPRLSISVHLFIVTTLLALSLVTLVAATASHPQVSGSAVRSLRSMILRDFPPYPKHRTTSLEGRAIRTCKHHLLVVLKGVVGNVMPSVRRKLDRLL